MVSSSQDLLELEFTFPTDHMTLKNRLKERRAALNVNQQEMGRLCGVSRQTISLIERGDYSPSVTLALTIAKVCGVTVEDVFYLQEEDEDEYGEK